VEVLGCFLRPDFFRIEEERLILAAIVMSGDENRSAEREAEVVPSVKRSLISLVEKITRIEYFIAHKLVAITVELACPGLGGYQNRSAGAASVNCAVIGRQHLQLLDGVKAGEDDQGALAPVDTGIQNVAAVHVEGVVLNAASVYAILDAAFHSHHRLILVRLIANARR